MEDNDTERFEFYTRLMALNNTLQVRIRNHYEKSTDYRCRFLRG